MSEAFHVVTPADRDAEPPKAHPASPLAALRERLAAQKTQTTVDFPVIGRDGISVRFTKLIDYEELVTWQRKAEEKNKTVNWARFFTTALANTSQGIVIDGEYLEMSLASNEFIDLIHDLGIATDEDGGKLPVIDTQTALRVFFGSDGAVIATGTSLVREAGYGDEITPDPTTG